MWLSNLNFFFPIHYKFRYNFKLWFDISGNSISNDLVFDWTQKNEIVAVSVLVGPGHDNRTVNIHTEPTRLSVSLLDGRKFSTKLYETIVPEGTSISFKGPRCIIKLLKNDPNIEWLQLEVRMISQDHFFLYLSKASRIILSVL